MRIVSEDLNSFKNTTGAPQAYFIVGCVGGGKSTYAKNLIKGLGLKESEVFIQDDDIEIEKYSGIEKYPEPWMFDKAEEDIKKKMDDFIASGGWCYINVNAGNLQPKGVYDVAELLCDNFGFDINVIVIDSKLEDALYARSGRVPGQRRIEEWWIEGSYELLEDILKDNGKSYIREIERNITGNVSFRIYKR